MISGSDLFKILGDTVAGRTLKHQVKRRLKFEADVLLLCRPSLVCH
jgi:hypothetical protein